MEWLKAHSYIAGWLSPTIALIGMLIRGSSKSGELDWARMMLYLGFLSCLAAVFTPLLDDAARIFAGCGVVALTIFFMTQVDADGDLRRAIERKAKGIEPPPQKPEPPKAAAAD